MVRPFQFFFLYLHIISANLWGCSIPEVAHLQTKKSSTECSTLKWFWIFVTGLWNHVSHLGNYPHHSSPAIQKWRLSSCISMVKTLVTSQLLTRHLQYQLPSRHACQVYKTPWLVSNIEFHQTKTLIHTYILGCKDPQMPVTTMITCLFWGIPSWKGLGISQPIATGIL